MKKSCEKTFTRLLFDIYKIEDEKNILLKFEVKLDQKNTIFLLKDIICLTCNLK